jgi:hypothetical protein
MVFKRGFTVFDLFGRLVFCPLKTCWRNGFKMAAALAQLSLFLDKEDYIEKH